MLRSISEIESIGDACYNLARTLHRKHESKKEFTEKQHSQLKRMMQLTDNALTQMNVVMNGRKEEQNMKETERIENEINELRTILKEQNIQDVNNHQYDYSIGTIYIDLINECEKLGDYVVNVMEARLGK